VRSAPTRPRRTIVPTWPLPGIILPRFRYCATVGPVKPLELRSLAISMVFVARESRYAMPE